MCRKTDAVAAQDAAAEALTRACNSRFRCEDLRNPITVMHLPAAPGDFAGLLDQLRDVPLQARTKH